jgi:hypothetical protein
LSWPKSRLQANTLGTGSRKTKSPLNNEFPTKSLPPVLAFDGGPMIVEYRHFLIPPVGDRKRMCFQFRTSGDICFSLVALASAKRSSRHCLYPIPCYSLLAKTFAPVLAVRRNFLSAHMFDNLISYLDAACQKVYAHKYF